MALGYVTLFPCPKDGNWGKGVANLKLRAIEYTGNSLVLSFSSCDTQCVAPSKETAVAHKILKIDLIKN